MRVAWTATSLKTEEPTPPPPLRKVAKVLIHTLSGDYGFEFDRVAAGGLKDALQDCLDNWPDR